MYTYWIFGVTRRSKRNNYQNSQWISKFYCINTCQVLNLIIRYRLEVALLLQLGVEFDSENQVPKFNLDTFETNISNVFVAGVVTGGITNKVLIDDGRLHGINTPRELAALFK
ncbi:hypothetical protein [Paenibacillus sp. P36]|uniref:hypothetical protein n=1 Tax=Paenibacillus sp. P36 TaxID=3342538 RepID=UPI0038B37B5F